MIYKYPFSAIVGQARLKKALLLCAVNPSIGGVLIKGEKGTAKSTAARSLAEVMPVIEKVKDSFFNLSKQESLSYPLVEFSDREQMEEVPVPFVDLPLGASEERVIGSLDLAAIVSEKKKKLLPGLLAQAHRGVLYVDEVNLLADHLVDVLLDVAASGINTVQRDGLSASHPSRFILIGTMNPEEGNLRPQFLDRFGLMVDVEAQRDVADRTEVVKRRIAFELDPEKFNNQWKESQQILKTQTLRARQLLPLVTMPEGLLTLISQLCIDWSVASLRADIVMHKTAVTIAALANRTIVNADDIREAAGLVLVHRKGKKPFEQTTNNSAPDQNQTSAENAGQKLGEDNGPSSSDIPSECEDGNCELSTKIQVFKPSQLMQAPKVDIEKIAFLPDLEAGRRISTTEMPKGFQVRVDKVVAGNGLAVSETIQQAMARNPDIFQIKNEDLRYKITDGETGHFILFVVDASGSMAAGKRMEAVKGSVMTLLEEAYQKRDTVGVIAFRGVEAQLLLAPTRSVELAERALEVLPTGGRTPLAHALQLASEVVDSQIKVKNIKPLIILLSDGKANVPLPGGGDAWIQSLELASRMARKSVKSMVLDTESGYLRLGRAAELARAMNAEYLSMHELSSDKITETINHSVYD